MTENYSKQPSPDGIVFHPLSKNKRFKDLTGKVYHHFTVLGFAGRRSTAGKHREWYIQCECGTIKKAMACNFTRGSIKSCGCKKFHYNSIAHKSHGMSMSSEFLAWHNMKARCYNPNENAYNNYGGRGITVCGRWLESFENFYADMGDKPSDNHSIDRIDVNGNYEPVNCRWATSKQQSRNTRVNVLVDFNGKQQCVASWEDELGYKRGQLGQRLRHGWDVVRAFTTPIEKHTRRSLTPQS